VAGQKETSEVRWVTAEEAARLIAMTTNIVGKARDLAVLEEVIRAIKI
jgi:hypothetical protein